MGRRGGGRKGRGREKERDKMRDGKICAGNLVIMNEGK